MTRRILSGIVLAVELDAERRAHVAAAAVGGDEVIDRRASRGPRRGARARRRAARAARRAALPRRTARARGGCCRSRSRMIGVTCACSRCRRYGKRRFGFERGERELGEHAVLRRAELHAVGDLPAMVHFVQHAEAMQDRERGRMEGRRARRRRSSAGRFSATVTAMPASASASAAVSPTGPAPAMSAAPSRFAAHVTCIILNTMLMRQSREALDHEARPPAARRPARHSRFRRDARVARRARRTHRRASSRLARTLPAARVVDCSGRWIMPGVIDPHVHFGFGSPETDFLTESRSAALGGVTSRALVLSHRRLPRLRSTRIATAPRRKAASTSACTSASRATCTSRRSRNARGASASRRTSSTSCTRARQGSRRASPRSTTRCCSPRQGHRRHRRRRARHPLRERRGHSLPARAVAPRGPRRPRTRGTSRAPTSSKRRTCIARATSRARSAARSTSCTCRAREALDEVRRHRRASKAPIHVETCPHYLLLDDASPAGVLAKVNPPIRGRGDVEAMWEGIADGSIDTVGTDHVPRKRSTKAGKGIWASSNGFPGRGDDAADHDSRGLSSPRHRARAHRRRAVAQRRAHLSHGQQRRARRRLRRRHHHRRSRTRAHGRSGDARIVRGLFAVRRHVAHRAGRVATYVRGRRIMARRRDHGGRRASIRRAAISSGSEHGT